MEYNYWQPKALPTILEIEVWEEKARKSRMNRKKKSSRRKNTYLFTDDDDKSLKLWRMDEDGNWVLDS